jgi:hypothetical protein
MRMGETAPTPWQKIHSPVQMLTLHNYPVRVGERVRIKRLDVRQRLAEVEGRVTYIEDVAGRPPCVHLRDWDGVLLGKFDRTNSVGIVQVWRLPRKGE